MNNKYDELDYLLIEITKLSGTFYKISDNINNININIIDNDIEMTEIKTKILKIHHALCKLKSTTTNTINIIDKQMSFNKKYIRARRWSFCGNDNYKK
jgi:hypothetical protein